MPVSVDFLQRDRNQTNAKLFAREAVDGCAASAAIHWKSNSGKLKLSSPVC
jgi:hypothetical protein